MSAVELVNTELYPIEQLDSSQRADLVANCRRDLDERAICCLPEFIRPAGLRTLTTQMQSLQPIALTKRHLSTAYTWMNNTGFPTDHPKSALFNRRFSYVLTDQIAPASPIKELFQWDAVTEFVRDALGFKTLFRSACPTLSIQLNYMYEDDVLPWHFDTNDGVVSLLLDSADDGGHFQVAPYVRDEDDEHYDKVARVFDDDPALIATPPLTPGTFVLFKGRRSMHRVSPVGKTTKPRMIVLYSYDEKPGMVFTQASCNRMKNPDSASFLGGLTPPGATGFQPWPAKP